MRKDGVAIINGKVFRAVRGGVKILDCRTMTRRFIANSWYTGDKLAEILQIRLIKYHENPFNNSGPHCHSGDKCPG